MDHDIIKGLIYSVFEDEGPIPIVTFPEDMEEVQSLTIAMKSISLLMGDQIYQGGTDVDTIRYFGILPFPDYKLTSLTFFFLIADEEARGHAKAATCSLLIDDKKSSFIYENMKDLTVFFAETAQVINKDLTKDQITALIQNLLDKIIIYTDSIKKPIESVRNIKILFTGLDASGKTSFLRAIRQKYSELTGISPTKGIERREKTILGVSLSEWDIGGQEKYRKNFLKQADLYLFDTNLLFFLIDIRVPERYLEAFEFFTEILQILESFDQYPPLVICLHKYDPDLSQDSQLEEKIEDLQNRFIHRAKKFQINFYKTSIFNQYSLNKAFSKGINSISPNREILRGQLQWLSQICEAKSMLLVDNNNIILSDYSSNKEAKLISEMAAPHFKNLYKTFSDFKFLKQKFAIWRMDEASISFFNIVLTDTQVFLLTLHRNHKEDVEKLKNNLEEFKKRISTLIESYL